MNDPLGQCTFYHKRFKYGINIRILTIKWQKGNECDVYFYLFFCDKLENPTSGWEFVMLIITQYPKMN